MQKTLKARRAPTTPSPTSDGFVRPTTPEEMLAHYRPAAQRRQVHRNLRRHFRRTLLRATTLLAVDLLAFAALRLALHLVRGLAVSTPAGATFVAAVIWEGYLGGLRMALALVLALVITDNYGRGDARRDPGRLLLACALAVAFPLWGRLWEAPLTAALQYLVTVPLLYAFVLSERVVLDIVLTRMFPISASAARTVLVGDGAECLATSSQPLFAEGGAFSVLAHVDTTGTASADQTGHVDELERVLQRHRADTVVLCGALDEGIFVRAVRAAISAECQVLAPARRFAVAGVQPEIVWRRGQPLVELRAPTLRVQQLLLKRILDVAVAATALLALVPLMAVLALAIRAESAGPVFFGQARLGRFGRYFYCFKFRSMYVDAEHRLRADAGLFAEYMRNDFKLPPERDARVTRVGRFLRRTSLDEIPQLWNVLIGDMSLVGPRPIVPPELAHYSDEIPLFLSLKPGMTGAWGVSGRSSITYPARATLELEYIQNWSLGRDISILLRTVPAVLLQRGAH